MQKKLLVYCFIFCTNSLHCMNIISSLHNLETKLSQIKQFLVKKESLEPATLLFQQLESRISSLERLSLNLDINIDDLFNANDLKNMQIDNSGNPLNAIARKAVQNAELAYKNYINIKNNLEDIEKILSKIGNLFKNNSLTLSEKTQFFSILVKFQEKAKILKNIVLALAHIDLKIFQNLKFQGTSTPEHEDTFSLGPFINYLRKRLSYLEKQIFIGSSRIKELVENDTTSLKKDIQEIKNLEQQVQNLYEQVLQIFEQIKKFGAPGKQLELNQVFDNFKKINLDPLNKLIDLIGTLKVYAPFIKDTNIKKELSIALQNPNLKINTNFSQAMEEFPNNFFPSDINPVIHSILALLPLLEDKIQEAESALK